MASVCLRRFAFTPEQAYAFADALIRPLTIRRSADVALLDGCGTLYSEDMQHGQVIDGSLTV